MTPSSPAALARVVGLWGAVWMGLGSILGTGVFVSLGLATGLVGSGVVVAVGLAALLALANGLSSAQLASAHPVSGGTYAYGRRYLHPTAGFIAGWTFLVAKSASAATAALGCAGYLLHALSVTADPQSRTLLALALVLLVTALVAGGVQRSNRANQILVTLTLLALAAFVLGGALRIDPARLPERLGWSVVLHGTRSSSDLLHATALLFVAYTGYGRIATLGEEVREPARTIPRAILLTLGFAALVYLSVAATAVAAVGADAFARSTQQSAAPLAVIARGFELPFVVSLLAVGAITAMVGVLLNLILGLSRVLLSMARHRDLPPALAHVPPESQSPRRAVWATGGGVALLVGIGDLQTTWSFSAFHVLLYYGITHLAALQLPTEDQRFPRWIAWVGLLTCFGLAFFVDLPVWVTGSTLLAAGLVVRHLLRHPSDLGSP